MNQSFSQTDACIYLPSLDLSIDTSLSLPKPDFPKAQLVLPEVKSIALPSREELGREYREDVVTDKPRIELLSLYNPFKYLAERLAESGKGTNILSYVESIAASCGTTLKGGRSFSTELIKTVFESVPLRLELESTDVERVEYTFSYRERGVLTSLTYEKPGKVERTCCELLHLIEDDKRFALGHGTEITLRLLNEVLTSARREVRRELPQMPDLTLKLVSLLKDSYDKTTRDLIYDLLEQTSLPPETTELLLSHQGAMGDLKHPSTFKNLLTVSEVSPAHEVVVSQQRLRAELLSLLSSPPQALFDHFCDLKEVAGNLIISSDPRALVSGKIGLEIEFRGKGPLSSDPVGWETGEDGACWETRRAASALEYGSSYAQSLHSLYRFLRDNAKEAKTGVSTSLHIHLDRTRHKYTPHMGELLLGRTEWEEPIRANDLGTHEVRGLIPPSYGAAIPPAPLHDLIVLLIEGAKETSSGLPLLELKDGSYSEQQLLWGHLCRHLQSPEGRLAALKTVSETPSLSLCTPSVVMGSYRPRDASRVLASLDSAKGLSHFREASKLARGYVDEGRLDLFAEEDRLWSSLVYQREWGGLLKDTIVPRLESENESDVREALDLLECQESLRGFFLDELRKLQEHKELDIRSKAKKLFDQWHGIY